MLTKKYASILAVLNILVMTASAEAGKILVTNECFLPVDVAIRYRDSRDRKWKTEYWYHFLAGERAYLATDGKELRTSNYILYFFAENKEYNVVWSGDSKESSDRTYEIGDRSLRFRKNRDEKKFFADFFTEFFGYVHDIDLACSNYRDPMETRCEQVCHDDCLRQTTSCSGKNLSELNCSPRSIGFDGACLTSVGICRQKCMSTLIEKWKANRDRR